jgi:hypothetical protein
MSKRITFFTYLLFLLLVFLNACQEKEAIIPQPTNAPIGIPEAKQWYEEHYASVTEIPDPAGRINYSIKRKLLWEFAQNFRLPNGLEALSIPLEYDSKHHLGKGNQTKLILFIDKQGKFNLQIMKVIGSTKFFRENTHLQSLAHFTGVVMMYDWQENFLSGVKYTEGHITGEVTPASHLKNSRVSGVCQEVRIEYYVDVCINKNCSGQRLDYAETVYVCAGGSSGSDSGLSAANAGTGVNYGNGTGNTAGYENEHTRSEETKRQAVVRDGESDLFIPGIDNPAIDLKAFLACFGTVQSEDYIYSITIYVEEPEPGSSSSSTFTGNVGHTCIGFTKVDKNDPSSSINQIIGFYPQIGKKSLTFLPTASEIHNNGDSNPERRTQYTISSTYDVSPTGFQAAIQTADELSSLPYDLNENNCTDYVFNIMNSAGVNVPQNKGAMVTTTGHNPGQLGYDLRKFKEANPDAKVNLTAGLTMQSKGSCY